MSTGDIAYGEELAVPQQSRPAFGYEGPPPEVEARSEDAGPLDRRTEAWLAFAIVTPVVATYAGVAYGIYLALSHWL
jgi:hypothetical protein